IMSNIYVCYLGNDICGRTSELMGGHDNPHIVWDELAGMWLTLLPLSYMGIANGSFWQNIIQIPTIVAIIIAFILFRFFDIIKPPPIGWADKKVAGGLGIMLDDIIAGVMAAAVWVILYTFIFSFSF